MGELRKDLLPDAYAYHDSEGEPLKGPGAWGTRSCPFHGGSDSMRVHRESGGFACMACGEKGGDVLGFHMKVHGLDFITAAKALGAWIDDGKAYKGPTRGRRLPAAEALELLYQDSNFVWLAGANIANGVELSEQDRLTLREAARRIYLITQESHS